MKKIEIRKCSNCGYEGEMQYRSSFLIKLIFFTFFFFSTLSLSDNFNYHEYRLSLTFFLSTGLTIALNSFITSLGKQDKCPNCNKQNKSVPIRIGESSSSEPKSQIRNNSKIAVGLSIALATVLVASITKDEQRQAFAKNLESDTKIANEKKEEYAIKKTVVIDKILYSALESAHDPLSLKVLKSSTNKSGDTSCLVVQAENGFGAKRTNSLLVGRDSKLKQIDGYSQECDLDEDYTYLTKQKAEFIQKKLARSR